MQRKWHRKRSLPTINIIALVDCIILLLIFFAVTTTVASSTASMKVNLPKAKTTVKQNGNVVISLNRDGRLAINDNEVTWDQLHSRLTELGTDSPGTAVIVNADKGVIYDSVVRILDEVKGAGLNNLSLAVTKEKAG